MRWYAAEMDVAITELRANLKSYIERASAGERVVVTERGVPVARLGPAEEESLLDRLERKGVLTRAKTKRPSARRGTRIKADGPVADLVSEMREDRDARILG
jgi:prevent-host-death family protein